MEYRTCEQYILAQYLEDEQEIDELYDCVLELASIILEAGMELPDNKFTAQIEAPKLD